MAKYKGDPANEGYNAGDTFNYAVWTAETELTLCNVPWDAVYKDVVHFESTNALNDYIDANGDSTVISNAMYARIDEPISIDMPLGRSQRYNYIRVFNPAQPTNSPDAPKYYYYFIRGIRHVAPETTEIVVQLDVWQTYIRLVQFGRAYIERGHIGIANEHNFRNFGRDYLTIPEGLDTGSSYVNVASRSLKILDPFNNNVSNPEATFNVMAISTVDLNGQHGTEQEPKNPSAKPGYIQQQIPSGAAAYFWESATEFMAFLRDFSTKPWVTAGIVSITLIPDMKRYLPYGYSWGDEKDPVTRAHRGYVAPQIRRNLFTDWRNSPEILNYIPQRYRHLKKLLTSPYCMVELTFSAGSAIGLKPEAWNSPHATILEMLNIIPPDQRFAVVPLNYNGRNQTPATTYPGGPVEGNLSSGDNAHKDGDYLDTALFLSNFPTIPIVNNGQITALATSARSMAAQYSGNDWAQQRALRGNDVGFDQATASMNASRAQSDNAIWADQSQTQIGLELASQQALFNMLGGTASGAGMGAFAGPAGAVAGAAGGLVSGGMGMLTQGMQADAANRSLGVRTHAAGSSADISGNLSTVMRDSNKGLADWAAKGDYANNRSALDAKVQDMQMTPHGMSGQFGGETFNLVNDEMSLVMRVKMPDQASITTIGEYWLRYGYPVRRAAFIPHDLRVMDKFSYWKMTEVYIRTAGMPETFKQTIRGILEKGVTVWSSPDDMGMIDFADNRPLSGVVIEGYEPPSWAPEPDPEPPVTPKRKKRKMIVFATNDAGMKWALAGTAPGTGANFIITESETLANQFMAACGVDAPVMLEVSTFYEFEVKYLSPVSTLEYVEGV